jgi:hypothetical protein
MADLYPQVDLNQTRNVTSITQRLPFSAILILQRIGIVFRCQTGNAPHRRDLRCLRDAMASRTGIVYRNIERHGLMCDGGPKWGRSYDISIEGAFPEAALLN